MSDTTTIERAPAQADQPGQTRQAELRNPGKRKLMLTLLAATVAVAGAAYGAYYYTIGRFGQSTDDAYVSGNLVQLTPQVSGTVVAVNADDTQIVKQGDPVVTLDGADARVALLNAEATLGQTVRQVSGLYVNNDFYAANIAQRESDLARANDDLKRREAVAGTGAVSGEDISHAQDSVRSAQASLEAARQQAEANHALTDRTTIGQHPDVQAAASKVRDAYLDYARDTLPAPVTGYVARRSVQVGQRVAPGTPLMAIVPLDGVWVDANFKEVQLERMRTGQPVTVRTDLYGHQVTYHGHVAGIAAGSGNAFALLPSQNASGNWIKIVQRVPVRILLDPNELEAHPLRIGLSTTVRVDLHNASGPLLSTAVRNVPLPKQMSAGDDPTVDTLIAAIIADNAGPHAQEPAKLSRNKSRPDGAPILAARP